MINAGKFKVVLINDCRVVDVFAGVVVDVFSGMVVDVFAGISTFLSQFARCECNWDFSAGMYDQRRNCTRLKSNWVEMPTVLSRLSKEQNLCRNWFSSFDVLEVEKDIWFSTNKIFLSDKTFDTKPKFRHFCPTNNFVRRIFVRNFYLV